MIASWGSGEHGALGHGKGVSECLLPRTIKGDFLQGKSLCLAVCGDTHSIALDTQGNVFTWGRNREGQLGNGERSHEPQNEPKRVEGLAHERIAKAAAGTGHSLVLSRKGELYAFGAHYESTGRRDLSDQKKRMIEKSHLAYFAGNDAADAVDSVIAGGEMLCLSEADSEMSAGEEHGPLGEAGRASTIEVGDTAFKRVIHSTPWVVTVGQRLRVSEIAAGHCFSAAVSEQGGVYTWGYNDKGQLGLGDRLSREQPTLIRRTHHIGTEVQELPTISSISCGEQHCIALDDTGRGWSFGLGVFGQLGLGDCADRLRPARIDRLELERDGEFAASATLAQAACGMYHSVFMCPNGIVYVCGHREYGQQGEANNFSGSMSRTQCAMTPKQLSMADSFQDISLVASSDQGAERQKAPQIVAICSGTLHSAALTVEGEVITWGWGGTGALGHGWGETLGRKFAAAPARAVKALKGENVISIAAGRRHTIAVLKGSSSYRLLRRDMHSLVETPRWPDVVFVLRDGATQHANRAIVAARSSTLAAMIAFSTQRFAGRSADGTPVRVEIRWARAKAFAHVLSFIYTDEYEAPASVAVEVLHLATRFGLTRLKALCIRILQLAPQQIVNATTATEILSYALSPVVVPPPTLPADARAMFTGLTPWEGDIKLICQAHPELKPICAHKIVIASRCPYFDTALSSEFLEGRGGAFSISLDDDNAGGDMQELLQLLASEGVTADQAPAFMWRALESVVEFMYTGEIVQGSADNEGVAFHACALKEADKFMLQEMVDVLEELLERRAGDCNPSQRQALCALAHRLCAVRLAESLQESDVEICIADQCCAACGLV